uniref:Putative tick kunitz 22 n=1 Tax=Amblyomma cajennense TaxID=34607 RepID=A0A023FPR4_AMBCJ
MRVLLVAALLFTSCAAFFYEGEEEEQEHGIQICAPSGNEDQCRALCTTPPDDGPCRALIPRWGWYGSSCEQFFYGGCYGNNNSFPTENDCKKACSNYRYPQIN